MLFVVSGSWSHPTLPGHHFDEIAARCGRREPVVGRSGPGSGGGWPHLPRETGSGPLRLHLAGEISIPAHFTLGAP